MGDILNFKSPRNKAYTPENLELEFDKTNSKRFRTRAWSKSGEGLLKNCQFVDWDEVPEEFTLWMETGEYMTFRKCYKHEHDFGGGSTVEFVILERVG